MQLFGHSNLLGGLVRPSMRPSESGLIAAVLAAAVMSIPVLSQAGPHEGGTLILHANSQIVYTSDESGYCGQSGLAACQDAIVSVPAQPMSVTVFFALAAFRAGTSPELIGVSFAVHYDMERLVLVATGHCADYEINTPDWPLPGSGTAVAWDYPQSQFLVELRWFAAYAVDESVATDFALGPHPTEGGIFIGDWPGTPIDEIADYGRLGFGMDGDLPCPDGAVPTKEQSWGELKARFR